MKPKVLFVSTRDPESREYLSGGTTLSLSNLTAIRRFAEVLNIFTIDNNENILNRIYRYAVVFTGRLGGLTFQKQKLILEAITEYRPDILYLDHSQLGILARLVKLKHPNLPIITHFHNIETEYIETNYSKWPVIKQLLVAVAQKTEWTAAQYSNHCLVLTEADRGSVIKINKDAIISVIPAILNR